LNKSTKLTAFKYEEAAKSAAKAKVTIDFVEGFKFRLCQKRLDKDLIKREEATSTGTLQTSSVGYYSVF